MGGRETYGGEVVHECKTADGEGSEEIDDVGSVRVGSHIFQFQL